MKTGGGWGGTSPEDRRAACLSPRALLPGPGVEGSLGGDGSLR